MDDHSESDDDNNNNKEGLLANLCHDDDPFKRTTTTQGIALGKIFQPAIQVDAAEFSDHDSVIIMSQYFLKSPATRIQLITALGRCWIVIGVANDLCASAKALVYYVCVDVVTLTDKYVPF